MDDQLDEIPLGDLFNGEDVEELNHPACYEQFVPLEDEEFANTTIGNNHKNNNITDSTKECKYTCFDFMFRCVLEE